MKRSPFFPVQDPALGLVQPHTTALNPSIQPVQIPLQNLPVLQQISTPALQSIICKLAQGAFDPPVRLLKILNI